MTNETTFLAIKPGFAQKQKIVNFIEETLLSSGCKIASKVATKYSLDNAMAHYSVIPPKYQVPAATYLSSAPLIGYILEDDRPENARDMDFISYVRSIQGDTRCQTPGTIRHTVVTDPAFAEDVADVRAKFMNKEKGIDEITTNIAHASDSPENFVREIKILISTFQNTDTNSNSL